MSSAREQALDAIKVGDVIYGVGATGDGKLLLVYQADAHGFHARHVTTQTWAEFDRSGKSIRIPGGGNCTIASTAALPSADYAVAVGLDYKMRTAKELTDLRLSKAEIQLLKSYDDYFRARLLPE